MTNVERTCGAVSSYFAESYMALPMVPHLEARHACSDAHARPRHRGAALPSLTHGCRSRLFANLFPHLAQLLYSRRHINPLAHREVILACRSRISQALSYAATEPSVGCRNQRCLPVALPDDRADLCGEEIAQDMTQDADGLGRP
jgi:hypothetical protein